MAGPNVGFATMQIIPSLRGIDAAVARDLHAPLTKASGEAGDEAGRSFGSRMASSLGSAGALISKAALVGVGAAVAGIAALGVAGIRAAGDFQQTRIAFEGILGSAGAADQFLQKLRQFAATTPFEFPELATATQRLLSLGQSGDQAIETLRTIGNAAAAVGAGAPEIEGVVTAIAQIQAKGKLSAEELNQIAERLPNFNRGNFFGILAEQTGKSVDEIKKLSEQGLITADVAIPALMESLKQVPGAMGAMDRQSQTLNGVLSTLSDTLRNALVDAFEPLLPAITSGIQKVTPLFEGFLKTAGLSIAAFFAAFREGDVTSDGVVGVFERIGVALRSVVQFFVDNRDTIGQIVGLIVNSIVSRFQIVAAFVTQTLIPALRPVFDALLENIPKLLPLFAQLQQVSQQVFVTLLDALRPVVPIVGQVLAIFVRFAGTIATGLVPVIRTVGSVIRFLNEDLKVLKPLLIAVAGGFVAWKTAVTGIQIGKTVVGPIGTLKTAMEGVSQVAATKGISSFKAFGSVMAESVKSTKLFTAAQAVLNAVLAVNPIILITLAVIAIGAAFFLAYKKIEPFRNAVDAVGRAIRAAFAWLISSDLGNVILAVFAPFIGIPLLIIKNFGTIIDFFKGLLGFFLNSGFGQAILAVFLPFIGIPLLIIRNFGTIVDFFVGVFEGIKAVVTTALQFVIDYFTGWIELFRTTFEAGWNFVKDVVTAAWEGIKAVVKGAFDLIIGYYEFWWQTFSAAWQAAWNFVRDIVVGAWNAITGFVSAAFEGYGRIIRAGMDAAVGFVRSGIDTVLGFFRNLPGQILAFVGGVLEAAKGIGSAIIDGIAAGVRGAAGFVGDFVSGLGRAIKSMINTQIIDRINDAIPNSIGLGPFGSIGLPDNPIPRLSFAQGGIVPGPLGMPTLAVVHGGETVRNTRQEDAILAELQALRAAASHDTIILNGDVNPATVRYFERRDRQRALLAVRP